MNHVRVALVAVVMLLALVLTLASGARVAHAQVDEWDLACPAVPAWIEAGESFVLTATPDERAIAAGFNVEWTIDGWGQASGSSTDPITFASPSDARERNVSVRLTNGVIETAPEQCGAFVVIEPGATVVYRGENLQRALNAAGPNAVVYLEADSAAGEGHKENLNVRPLDGQTISGRLSSDGMEILTTLDGAGTENVFEKAQAAFLANPGESYPTVTIKNLNLRNWTTYQGADGSLERSGFFGVIHAKSGKSTARFDDTPSDGDSSKCAAGQRVPDGHSPEVPWTLSNLRIEENDGAGVVMSSGMTLRDSVIANNAHIGIGGSYIAGALIDNVRVFNNATAARPNYHAGGLKITRSTGVEILNSTFSGNTGPGIWLDIQTWGNRVVNNTAQGNSTFGIFQEISWASEISGNTSTGNGDGDLLISESGGYQLPNGRVVVNVVENNRIGDNGLRERDADRNCDYRAFTMADVTLQPSTTIDGFDQQFNVGFETNSPRAVGATDARTSPTGYVPRFGLAPTRPVAPVSCSVDVNGSSATVTWQRAQDDRAVRFLLYRFVEDQTRPVWTNSKPAEITTMVHQMTADTVSYAMKSKSADSQYSALTNCSFEAPVPPLSCVVRVVGDTATVTWRPAADDQAQKYLLYRMPAVGEPIWADSVVASESEMTYQDPTSQLVVDSFGVKTRSVNSVFSALTRCDQAPTRPVAPVSCSVDVNGSSATVTWERAPDDRAVRFLLYRFVEDQTRPVWTNSKPAEITTMVHQMTADTVSYAMKSKSADSQYSALTNCSFAGQ